MIDIDKLERLAIAVQCKIGGLRSYAHMKNVTAMEQELSCGNVLELITSLRESEKDAARYRFMRDMSDLVDVSRFFHIDVIERDAEIDQAMKEKGDE